MHISHQFSKKRDAYVLTNYRQILVTPKAFERMFLNQVVEYLKKFALLNKNQFVFQFRNMSTDAVLYFVEKNYWKFGR